MKKILFYAGALALLATGCAKDQLDTPERIETNTQGITFDATLAENPSTKGTIKYEDELYKFSWYGQSRTEEIAVWGTNIDLGDAGNAGFPKIFTGWSSWTPVATFPPAKYTTSQSGPQGLFTSVNYVNRLYFNGDIPSDFFIVYPYTEATSITADGEFTIPMPLLNDQRQTTGDGEAVTQKILMYSYAEGVAQEGKESVAEKLGIRFKRANTAVAFRTEGYDVASHGKLKSIKLIAATSPIDYGAANFTFDVAVGEDGRGAVVPGSSTSKEVELLIGEGTTGMEWNNDFIAYMAISPVERTGEELMTAVFTFDKGAYTVTASTSNPWPVKVDGLITFPTLNFDSYDYIVTDNNKTLIVNRGEFSSVLNAEGKVEWGAAKIAPTAFTKIISKVDADMTSLAKFINVTSLTLETNKSVSGLSALSKLTEINMPALTTIAANDTFNSGLKLKTVKLPSYKFPNALINGILLNETYLVELDMSAVTQFGENYGNPPYLSFNGFTKLKTVTVMPGVKLGQNAFLGCTALEEVNGYVQLIANNTWDLTIGAQTFSGCAKLKAITINSNARIPKNAFNGCKALTDIKVYDATNDITVDLKPIRVDESAFESCEKLVEVDLSAASTLGVAAFKGCKALASATVYAATIPANLFDGCTSLITVDFLRATTIGEDFFANTGTKTKTITFQKKISAATGIAITSFGPTNASDINYVNVIVASTQDVNLTQKRMTLGDTDFYFKSVTKL